MQPRIPLVILGGSDRKPGPMPEGVERKPLTGCKGVDIVVGGRYLVEVLIDRMRAYGAFGPIYIAGPKEAYAVTSGSDGIIDTDSGFGANIKKGIETVVERHGDGIMGIATCDILPEHGELEAVLADYRTSSPSDLWFPIIEAPTSPEGLGASDWKPKYFVAPDETSKPVAVLPSHLTIFDPTALRLGFLYRLMDAAYESRNKPIGYRNLYLARRLLLGIFMQDLRLLFRLRAPTLTWNVAVSGSRAALKLRSNTITRQHLEEALRRMFVSRQHRKKYRDRRIQLPILRAMSLARDIDTFEEAVALGGTAAAHS